ncbi:MAG: arylamine N-acetyltransferase, partial [Alphaproteobacteria bacterium]|nr:arylamine N-acetyltransferase [Alphaproteobacteria bacterium]
SGFLSSLMAARADLGCRHTLRDNRYTLRSQASADETRLIESVAEMREVLEGTFRIALPDGEELDRALDSAVRRR